MSPLKSCDVEKPQPQREIPNIVPTFFWEFLANPISLVLSVAVILLLLNQTSL